MKNSSLNITNREKIQNFIMWFRKKLFKVFIHLFVHFLIKKKSTYNFILILNNNSIDTQDFENLFKSDEISMSVDNEYSVELLISLQNSNIEIPKPPTHSQEEVIFYNIVKK
jgi:hypothetical protein